MQEGFQILGKKILKNAFLRLFLRFGKMGNYCEMDIMCIFIANIHQKYTVLYIEGFSCAPEILICALIIIIIRKNIIFFAEKYLTNLFL